jgi:heme exporter protein A
MARMLELTDISVARGGLPVLQGVTCALGAGQALILTGPNGVGKTTLLRAVAGLQPVLAGQMTRPSEGVAYAAHADALKPTLSVAENLSFWAEIFGTRDIAAALSAMGLEGLRHRAAQNLSAGQKRRLGLARLLVTGRKLWLLDEPTVSLDAAAVALFGAVIRAHLADGGAALMASHIDIGLSEASTLDLSPFRAEPGDTDAFDEAFA